MTNTPHPPIEELVKALWEAASDGLSGDCVAIPMNEVETIVRQHQAALYPSPDRDRALSLLRSICTPLDHNLEIQPGCATHRCIQAFLRGETSSEICDNASDLAHDRVVAQFLSIDQEVASAAIIAYQKELTKPVSVSLTQIRAEMLTAILEGKDGVTAILDAAGVKYVN